MKIFAYRGYAGKFPEDTMLAFQRAIEGQAQGIQLDVHLSRDREVVIIHDEGLSRTVDGVGFVRHHTLKDLQGYEVKGQYAGEIQHIPTLAEYLLWARDLPVETCIALRNDRFAYPGLEEAVVHLLETYGMEERVFLTSRRLDSLQIIKQHWPRIRCGWAFRVHPEALEEARSVMPEVLLPQVEGLSEDFVKEAQEQGYQVMPYVVDRMSDAKRMQDWGLDGVFTRYIESMRKLFEIQEKPYSDEQVRLALHPDLDIEKKKVPMHERLRLNKKNTKSKGGLFEILISMAISIAASVAVAKLVISLLSPILH